jgi:hypothetical protein
MSKEVGFVISDEDLKTFEEWIKKPEAVQQILEGHEKVLDACKSLDKFTTITDKLIHTPFTI